MLRKCLTLLLCLLMTLLAPLGALAATQYTFTIVPGDDLASVPAVKDTLDILSLKALRGEGACQFTIGMADADVFSAAVRADENGLFVKSDSVSADTLYLTWTELADAAKSFVKKSGADEQSASAIQQAILTLGAAAGSIGGKIANSDASLSAALPATLEEKTAMLEKVFAGDAEMLAWVKSLGERAVTTEGDFTDPAHDAATQKTELTLTNEDYLTILNTQYFKTMMDSIAKQSANTDDAVDPETMMASIKDFFTNAEISIPITVYSAGKGEMPVAVEMSMIMKGKIAYTEKDGDKEEETVDVSMKLFYNRLTTEAGVSHKGEMTVSDEGEVEATMVGDLLSTPDGGKNGSLMLLDDDTQVTFAYQRAPITNGVERALSIYVRGNATSPVAPVASDRPLITFKLQSVAADESVLADVISATPDTATQPLKLEGDAATAFLSDATTRLTQTLYTLMSKLPASVLSMVSEMTQAQTAQ